MYKKTLKIRGTNYLSLNWFENAGFQSSTTLPIPSMGRTVYLPTWMVDRYGFHVGNFSVRPMDGMGVSKIKKRYPKPSILIGFSLINHSFCSVPLFLKHPIRVILQDFRYLAPRNIACLGPQSAWRWEKSTWSTWVRDAVVVEASPPRMFLKKILGGFQ